MERSHHHTTSDSGVRRFTKAFAVVATTGLLAALVLLPHATPEAPLPETWWVGVMPFAALLCVIAVFPLVPAVAHWW
ncbi:MAG: hypothetical protein ACO3QC_02750, partial [Phycisphaerales bacterium]